MKSALFLLLALVYGVVSAPTKKIHIGPAKAKAKSFKLPITRNGFSIHDTSLTPARRISMIQSHIAKTSRKFGVTINSRISQRSSNNQQQMGDGPDDL